MLLLRRWGRISSERDRSRSWQFAPSTAGSDTNFPAMQYGINQSWRENCSLRRDRDAFFPRIGVAAGISTGRTSWTIRIDAHAFSQQRIIARIMRKVFQFDAPREKYQCDAAVVWCFDNRFQLGLTK